MLNGYSSENEINNNLRSYFQKDVDRHQGFIRLLSRLEPFFVRKIPIWKRAMDIGGAIIGLIIFSPILIFTSILIKVVSPGPVFFKQERVGYGGKMFMMWKFRTMKVNADVSGHH